MDFKDLIYNKHVIFVGPASTLIGSNNKKFIDSFDTIIKTNGLVPISDELISDYSDRCDILYCNISYTKLGKLYLNHYKKIKLQYLVFKALQYVNVKSLNIPYRCTPPGINNYTFTQAPTMGSIIINDVLEHKPSTFYITGMDFYTNDEPYITGYQPKNVDEIIKSKWKPRNNNFKKEIDSNGTTHNINDDFLYIYNQYKANKLIVDQYILQLFLDFEKKHE